MKKILVMFVVAMMASVSANAQHSKGEITIQPRVGVTFSNLTNTDGAKMKVNVAYGVEIEHYMAEQFGVAAGVLFADQGAKMGENKNPLNIYYLAVPITANYYVLPGLALKAGVQPSFRVKTNMKVDGQTYDFDKVMDYLFDDNNVKMNKFDLSIPVGLSYEYNGLTLDARYNFGITKLFSGVTDAVRNQVIVITLGYKI